MNKEIEIRAYVNGKLVAEAGPYAFDIASNDINEEDAFCIGEEILEAINKSFTVEVEPTNRDDYHRM